MVKTIVGSQEFQIVIVVFLQASAFSSSDPHLAAPFFESYPSFQHHHYIHGHLRIPNPPPPVPPFIAPSNPPPSPALPPPRLRLQNHRSPTF
ncbi:hypothetical protein COCNU_08G000660 [Cocos nucifera]|uniref:Uncharacterized protein n=1 Tax=Cocos nucifera TaxID=13894 RepID=A0A8K0N5Q6_COCNU|nr:hypothetical protein COCNU_08G000660 [Cocos nucifera]